MPIIDPDINSRPELTIEQKQQRAARRIKQMATELFSGMGDTYQGIREIVWQNPQGLTPQQVFDALGTEGAELFQLSSLLVQTVNAAKPDTLDGSQPYNFTVNDDGTVTVGEPVGTDAG